MKKVLVTGGTRGIGLATALKFVEKGYRTAAAYFSDEESAAAAKAAGIEVFRADVAKEEDVKALFRRFGNVDVLVNNAGISLVKQLQAVTAEEWDRLFAVNVRGAFLCAREAAKGMIAEKSGLIVNISSVWGEEGGSCESVYSASKGAVIAFTKALAKELAPSKITVNCVSPGVIDTDMNAKFSAGERAELCREIPLGRFGSPEEVARAVLFLAEQPYITGQTLGVKGGF